MTNEFIKDYFVDSGNPWYKCQECECTGRAEDLDVEENVIKCPICGSKDWRWV